MIQTCILVPGMHRSGTSALTGLLQQLGVFLGDELIEAMPSNEKGHFENRALFGRNEDLLKRFGASWEDVFVEGKIGGIPDEVSELKSTLATEFKGTSLFAIKDPRLALLFPHYKRALTELGIEVKVVIPYRDPFEVADSLHARNGFSIEKGLVLWGLYFFMAERFSRDCPRWFLSFEGLLADPRGSVENLDERLQLNLLARYDEARVSEFLTGNMRHYVRHEIPESAPSFVKNLLSFAPSLNDKEAGVSLESLGDEFFRLARCFYHKEILEMAEELKGVRIEFAQAKAGEEQHRAAAEAHEASRRTMASQVKALEAELAEVRLELSRELEATRQELKNAKREALTFARMNAAAQDECARIRATKSWKITRPLRRLEGLLK